VPIEPVDTAVRDSADLLPVHGDWFVLHTRSRQEKLVTADLKMMGLGVFLPLLRRTCTSGRRRTVCELPMFPGYVFLRGTRDDAFLADRTRRIAQIITVADQWQLDWELSNIHLALTRGVGIDPFPYLRQGMRVEVRSGPLRGLQGIVERREHPDRIALQVQMLGRAMSVEVDGAVLEPLD
jgi:transcription termination/antitermination protein NusG